MKLPVDTSKARVSDKMKESEIIMNEENKITNYEERPTYTLKQAREVLNVSNTTIFRLASNNDIESVEYVSAFNSNRVATHYTQKSVHAYKDRNKGIITVKGIVKEYGLNSAYVFNILKENKLEYSLDDTNFSKPTAVISEQVERDLRQLIAKKAQESENPMRKADFYRNGYGYLQKVVSADGTISRLIFGHNENENILGVFEGIDDFKTWEDAILDGYVPAYEIANLPSLRMQYVVIEAPQHGPITEVIDAAYKQIGYKNMYIKPTTNGNIILYLKESTLNFSDMSSFTEEWIDSLTLNNNCYIQKADSELLFFRDKKVSVKVDDSVLEIVNKLAKTMDKSNSEVLEVLASNYLKSIDKDN